MQLDQKAFDELVAKVTEAAGQKAASVVAEATKGFINLDEAKNAFKELSLDPTKIAIEGKSLDVILKEQGEALANAQKSMEASEEKPQSLQMQIKNWMKTNEKSIQAVKDGTAKELPALNLKVAITMTEAASLNSSAYLPRVEVAPGIVDLVRVQPTFWERLQKGRTRANPYVWVNKTNKQGNAAFIGEGVLKPLASFELETETSVPKKVAERMKASTELLYDVEGMESFIRDEISYEVRMAANTAVLTGTLSSTSPAGITTIASTYNLTSISTTNPNNSDAIRAAIAQIRSLNFNGTLTAFMNPIDMANMDLEKAVDSGVYMLPPFTTADGRVIAGVPVIEDNNIAVGYLLIGDMSKYRILMHQDFFIKWGWEDDDFSKNLMTVIGEMRFHQFYSSNHVGAWIYDSFTNIKAALEPEIV